MSTTSASQRLASPRAIKSAWVQPRRKACEAAPAGFPALSEVSLKWGQQLALKRHCGESLGSEERGGVGSPFYRSSMCSPACPTSLASSLRRDEELSARPSFVATRWQDRSSASVAFTCSREKKKREIRTEAGGRVSKHSQQR